MENSEIDNTRAKHLLRQMCKAISELCGTVVTPNYYSDGVVNIVSDDHEIARFKIPGNAQSRMFFGSASLLLEALMTPKVVMHFSPFGKDKVMIDASALLGTTIEEVKVRLDLMKA